MSFELLGLLLLLGVMIYLFLTEKIPVDLTALLGLLFFTLLGYLKPEEAFSGFSSPVVIAMLSVFCVGSALAQTGIGDTVALKVYQWTGKDERLNLIAIMLIAALVSSFMNNVAATVLLMPTVAAIADRTELSPSRLYIPLSFGILLGGTTTLIGTTPNMLAAQILENKGLPPFEFLDFTPFGVGLVVFGIIIMVGVGRRFLPNRSVARSTLNERDLPKLYRLHERLFSLRIPEDSSLHGKTLQQIHFGEALGAGVVAIQRHGRKILAPGAQDSLQGGDLLFVRGRVSELEEIRKFQGITVEAWDTAKIREVSPKIKGVIFAAQRSDMMGRSFREINFRGKYGLVVIGVERLGKIVARDVALERLQEGDLYFAIGTEQAISEFSESAEFDVKRSGILPDELLHNSLFSIVVPAGSPLVEKTVRDSRMGELSGLSVIGLVRDGDMSFGIPSTHTIQAGDQLIVAGETDRVTTLEHLGNLKVESENAEAELASGDIGVVEVVLAPRSQYIDKTLTEIHFREKFDFQVLAIWREGQPHRWRLSTLPLRFGDALLLQGPRSKVHLITSDPNFVTLSGAPKRPYRPAQSHQVLIGLFLMLALSVLHVLPVHIAAFVGALYVVLAGAITMQEVYHEMEWRVVVLVAALIPIGTALEHVGTPALASSGITGMLESLSPLGLLVAVSLVSSVISQALDSTLAVILLGPLTIEIAEHLGLNPYAYLMAITLSASIAFITPFSHRANLLVMGAGGYKNSDYFKVGTIITIVAFAVVFVMIPLVYELKLK